MSAHGLTHIVLTELDDQTLHGELIESKKVLERHINRPVDMMSVPQGPYDARVRKAAISPLGIGRCSAVFPARTDRTPTAFRSAG